MQMGVASLWLILTILACLVNLRGSTTDGLCSLQPCRNGGKCFEGPDEYKCECVTGWTGENCTQAVDRCDNNPCENGGKCFDGQTSYTCECTTGWTGVNCTALQEDGKCQSNPCKNGGQCLDAMNAYKCECSSGWTGNDCEQGLQGDGACISNPCQNEGECKDVLNAYTCECASGWTGVNCAQGEPVDGACLSYPCKNGGHCRDASNGYTCDCVDGWAGNECKQDTTETGPRDTNTALVSGIASGAFALVAIVTVLLVCVRYCRNRSNSATRESNFKYEVPNRNVKNTDSIYDVIYDSQDGGFARGRAPSAVTRNQYLTPTEERDGFHIDGRKGQNDTDIGNKFIKQPTSFSQRGPPKFDKKYDDVLFIVPETENYAGTDLYRLKDQPVLDDAKENESDIINYIEFEPDCSIEIRDGHETCKTNNDQRNRVQLRRTIDSSGYELPKTASNFS